MGCDGGSSTRQQFHGGDGLRELSRRGPVPGQERVLALRGIPLLSRKGGGRICVRPRQGAFATAHLLGGCSSHGQHFSASPHQPIEKATFPWVNPWHES